MFKLSDDLSGSLHKEKEKRVDLKALPKECKDIKPIVIKQGVLKEVKEDNKVVAYARIRMKQDPGKKPEYSLGVKNFSKNEEAEAAISKDTFDMFYPKNLEKPQVKDRFKLNNGWTVDKKDDGGIVAEFEYKNKDEIAAIPKDWEIKKEAMVKTYDPKKGPPPKIIKHESVDIPVVHLRDDAGEQGCSIQS
jgi:hypothetical protein